MVKKTNRPQPQPGTIMATAAMPEDVANNIVSMNAAKGKRPNRFAKRQELLSETAQTKVQLSGQARQKLAEAADLAAQGGQSEAEAEQTAAEAGFLLYQCRTTGVLSDDEISAMLGDTFGYRKKGDAKVRVTAADKNASKTPFGLGEAIRKRVVRAVKARDFVADGEAPSAFFEPLETDDVQPLLTELENGERSVWSVYDRLGELKKEASEGSRTQPAFDAARIAAIVKTLGSDITATVGHFQNNQDLFNAYGDLWDMLNLIGSEMPDDETAAA